MFKKEKILGIWGHQDGCSALKSKLRKKVFQFPCAMPAPQLWIMQASLSAVLFFLLLSFPRLRDPLYQKMRKSLPREAPEPWSQITVKVSWLSQREGSWWSLPVSPRGRSCPGKGRCRRPSFGWFLYLSRDQEGSLLGSCWCLVGDNLALWTGEGSHSFIHSFISLSSS